MRTETETKIITLTLKCDQCGAEWKETGPVRDLHRQAAIAGWRSISNFRSYRFNTDPLDICSLSCGKAVLTESLDNLWPVE